MKKPFLLFAFIVFCLLYFFHNNCKQKASSTSSNRPSNITENTSTARPSIPQSPEQLKDFQVSPDSIVEKIRFRHSVGDYEAALNLAMSALKNDPAIHSKERKWLELQLPILRESTAWLYLHLKEWQKACDLLEDQNQPHMRKATLKGLALCRFHLRQIDSSFELIEEFIKAYPKDIDSGFVQIAVEVYESYFEFDKAIELVKSQTPNFNAEKPYWEEQFNKLKAKQKAHAHQDTISTNHFTISFKREAQQQLAENALNYLESSLFPLIEILNLSEPRGAIEVIFHSLSEFKNTTGSPHWASGVFDGRIRIPVKADHIFNDSIKKVLLHELVHQLLYFQANGNRIVTWYDEGLAQLGSCILQQCQSFQFKNRPEPFLEDKDFTQKFIHLDRLTAKRAYQQSLYLIYQIIEIGGIESIREINKNLNSSNASSSDFLIKFIINDNKWSFQQLVSTAKASWLSSNPLEIK